jgi:hypothetical protein
MVRRMRAARRSCGAAATALAGLLLAAPAAAAQAPPNAGQLLYEGFRGPVDPAVEALSCAQLRGGTAGQREPPGPAAPDRGNGLAPGARTDAPRGLPRVVPFKTATETFNRRYVFAVRRGLVWFRSNAERTGIRQPWRELPVPPCLYGTVRQIAADDDEMIAIDPARRIHVMDRALADPAEFNWTTRWGPLFWQGDGHVVPRGTRSWAWSVLSPREDVTWTDPAGNRHEVGADKVSHIWMLRDDGRLVFNDPWLARDTSYESCAPHRGRLRVVDLAASGSTIFVVGPHGDLFTRLFDFDISGSDPVFFRYAYEDQRGLPDPAIQLPPPRWVEHPKVPGRITGVITIEKRGRGAAHRTLRVEGLDRRGRTGYWQKDLTARRARAWRFHRTGRRLLGRPLDNPRRDTSARGLGPSGDRRYARPSAGGWKGEIADFNVACSPARLRVVLAGGERIALRLHTADGLRLQPRADGLDDEPRAQYGAIEVPPRARRRAGPAARAWLARHLGAARFTTVDVQATTSAIEIAPLGWRFER